MSNIRELSQLAASIVVDDSTRNIGIGTSSPTSKLSVGGDLNVSGVITATSFYGDGSNLSNIVSGVGISSNGVIVGTGITSLDFVGISVTSITEENGNATIRFKTNDGINGIEVLDDISSNFNGQETTFTLSSNSTSISALNPQQLIVNLGGVLQSPGSDYSVSDSNIIFSTPPQSGLTFSAVSIGVTVGINVPADGSVTLPKIASGVLGVGIQSAGNVIGTGITTLNFIGAGNTFAVNGTTVDISIAGGGGGGGASVSISTEAPSNPSEGDLWYNSVLGRTFIYYNDDSSSQWVDSAPFNIPEPASTPGKSSYTFTATEGQTEFTVSYTAGYIDVFLNGIRLNSTEYLASNGSSITLVQEATAGDVLDVVEYRMGIGATGAPGANGLDGSPGAGGPLSNVTVTTDNSTFYPVVTAGTGSTLPYITTTSNYFEFTPASGTLKTNQLVVSGITTATDFDSSSDLNLKENVQVIENAIDKLVEISGVTFEWKETKQVSAGVIAQDVEKVFPEVVKTNEYKTVNYNGLIGLLVEVVKEQQEQINTLTKRIEVLEGN